jgi:hypothetical protein
MSQVDLRSEIGQPLTFCGTGAMGRLALWSSMPIGPESDIDHTHRIISSTLPSIVFYEFQTYGAW